MKKKAIPEVVIDRLPRYYRYFRSQLGQREKVSSRELADVLSTSASQVRLDLSYFGGFGLQGYGYNVEELYTRIGEILGIDQEQYYIIIGAGRLGRALADFPVFREVGFTLRAIFDNDPQVVGSRIGGVQVSDVAQLAGFVRNGQAGFAIITTPPEAAQGVADILCQNGIKGILNFAALDLNVSPGVAVSNIHLTDRLLALSYWIKEQRKA